MSVKVTRYKKDLTYEQAREWIFSDKDFLAEFGSIAKKQNAGSSRSREECEKYLSEIAAKYTKNRFFWNLMVMLVKRRIIGSFENIYYDKESAKAIKELAKNNIINFASNHRSVFDFLILPYILVKETTFMPIIPAANIFTAFPLGLIFRHNGVYFVRREVNNELYSLVFKYYVMMISRCELLHMFFIEGGRNKTGGYSEPKKGILKYILDGAKKYTKSDVVFVPISISYDCVPESRVVIEEARSGKRKHIFQSVASYIYKNNLGNCYIKFGCPINASDFRKKVSNKNNLINELGCYLMEAIKSAVIVSPTSLVCYTLLGLNRMSYANFRKKFIYNYEKLKKTKSDVSYINPGKIERYVEFADEKHIIDFDKSSRMIIIRSRNKNVVQYYSNNISHLFINKR